VTPNQEHKPTHPKENQTMKIVPLDSSYMEQLIDLADREIGVSYYSQHEILEQIKRSSWQGKQLSYLAFDEDELIGFRLTSAPGKWNHGRGMGLSPHLWKFPVEDSAYFQSCFIASSHMGRGIGKQLSLACIDTLRAQNIQQVIAHSWKESPHNSSFRYLTKLGFIPVIEYPDYWKEVDYECSLDGNPCRCTAIEMLLDLS